MISKTRGLTFDHWNYWKMVLYFWHYVLVFSFFFWWKWMLDPFFCIILDIVLVIMHYALCISHYADFGTHYKLFKFWVVSASLWVEPLINLNFSFLMYKKYVVNTVSLAYVLCSYKKCYKKHQHKKKLCQQMPQQYASLLIGRICKNLI